MKDRASDIQRLEQVVWRLERAMEHLSRELRDFGRHLADAGVGPSKHTPLSALNLSSRTHNTLRRGGYECVTDLTAAPDVELDGVYQLGKVGRAELAQALTAWRAAQEADTDLPEGWRL